VDDTSSQGTKLKKDNNCRADRDCTWIDGFKLTGMVEHARPGDQVWVSGAAEVNRARYYASQAGLPNV
jgi:hypothetical protein